MRAFATLTCLCLVLPLWAEPPDSINIRNEVLPSPRLDTRSGAPPKLPPPLLYFRYNLPENNPPKTFAIPHLRLQLSTEERQAVGRLYITSPWSLFPGHSTVNGVLNPALLPPLRMSKKDIDYLRGEGLEWMKREKEEEKKEE
jgi:hypothetical protein